MSAYPQVELRCDFHGPQRPFDCDWILYENSVQAVRVAARKAGWARTTRDGKKVDLCADHRPGGKLNGGSR